MNLLTIWFTNILNISFSSSIIALSALILRQIIKKKINISYIHLLIVLVILRFCLIIIPESPISILRFIPNYKKIEKTIPDHMIHTHNNNKNHMNQNSKKNNTQKNYIKNISNNLDNNIHKNKYILNIQNILAVIWISGSISIALIALILQLKLKFELHNANILKDPKLIYIIEECKNNLKIKKNVKVLIGNKFKGPCITGILNPCIYYPSSLINIDKNSFKNIILHELSHFKRKDLLTNNIILLAISLHWFNPIIWILIKIYRTDVELACDYYVLNKLGEKSAISYGKTILKLAKFNLDNSRNKQVVCYFSGNTKQLERRIKLIKKHKHSSIKITIIALLGVIVISSSILTNPISAKKVSNTFKINKENNIGKLNNILTTHEILRYNDYEKLYKDSGYKLIPGCYSKEHFDIMYARIYQEDMVAEFRIRDYSKPKVRFGLFISKIDPLTIKSLGKIISHEPMTIGNLQGQKVIYDNKYKLEEYFVYKIKDEYYGISFKTTLEYSKNKIIIEIPLTDVEFIINSLINVEDFDFTGYQSKDDIFMHTIDDMKFAAEQLGFKIKVPRSNPKLGKFGESSYFCKPINGYKSKFLSIHYDGKPGVSFTQSTTGGYYYDQFLKTGKFTLRDSEKGWYSDIFGEWVTINNYKMLKITDIYHCMENQKQGDRVNKYIIKIENNHYFIIECDMNTKQEDDIKFIKELLNTKYENFN